MSKRYDTEWEELFNPMTYNDQQGEYTYMFAQVSQ